ncbi:hypothetical protein shim_20850 [Shimia sp. SK013]|uniref:hypothetical protein n=1 Tax=Shimia sp. SK013 TaxID=1389006 RepID=UPI0006B47566|nr:hypothetical protein [Shimia sp. SK013]KPA21381.1 hypothetical protein shim_20850 [Shimia sp. SK013]
MKRLLRWALRGSLCLVLLLALLLSPVAYVETMCRGDAAATAYTPILPPEDHRPESRTLMTYPEWHIVHAYDDYATVIATNDPHDFGFFSAIGGFWSSLCDLSRQSAHLGPVDSGTKQMVYVIGVSFTAELALKALYEETFGRVTTWIRGSDHAALDTLTAHQAAEYAQFLQQVPWYKWHFGEDATALATTPSEGFRDTERRLAVGLEYRAKAAYAGVIAQAVENVGADALTLRMVVDAKGRDLSAYDAVEVVGSSDALTILQTPRYRTLTHLLAEMAKDGVQFIEIAGNDDIMFTTIAPSSQTQDAISVMPRQGHTDYRHIQMVKVHDLAQELRNLNARGHRLEHIHDY